ncbi:MAG: PadR family transcriptional regulator [Thermoplasmata archaeon]
MPDVERYLKKLDRELRTGLLSLLVLRGIQGNARARYGYRIIEQLKEKSNGNLVLPEGTVYPLLHALESHGLVQTEWVESDSGPPRKYYEITPHGEEALRHALILWRDLVASTESILGGMDVG